MIKKVKKGFTLIELVVVIAVIAILSAVSVVAYVGITNSAKKSAAQQEADQIAMTVRAAALTSADGYTERKIGNVDATESTARYKVVWTKDGLEFENLRHNAELTLVQVLEDMYEELEEKALADGVTLTVDADRQAAFIKSTEPAAATDWKSGAVESFKYKTASNVEVEAKFVK